MTAKQGQRNDNRQGDQVAKDIASQINKLNNLAEMEVDDLVKYSEDMGEYLKRRNLKTSQIRKVLDTIRRIEHKLKINRVDDNNSVFYFEELKLLKPQLAYAGGRNNNIKPLKEVLDKCVDKIYKIEDFQKFVRFVEGIVAYHRFYGGGE